jgi:hypothetical protein
LNEVRPADEKRGANMKRLSSWTLATALIVTAISLARAQNPNQSLGDYARALKKTKNAPATQTSPPAVYDNDNLPRTTTISVVGETEADQKDSAGNAKDDQDQSQKTETGKTEAQSGNKNAGPELPPGQSAEDRDKAIGAWKDKLSAQKDKIAQISHDLDLLQREYRVKQAEFYENTALRTQNPNGFADDDSKYKKDIDDKQKQLDDAKVQLDDLKEEARKAGVPNSALD